MNNFIGYIRVSTEDQGRSGNGLEAQRQALEHFAQIHGYNLLAVYSEEASGSLGLEDRPVLAQAVALSKRTKAPILTSKLDRFSRDAAFILNMMAAKVRFVVAAHGLDADEFTLHIYAVMAEKERKMIAQRTKDALAVLIAKGVSLGNPNAMNTVAEDGTIKIGRLAASSMGGEALAVKADDFADKMYPTISRMRDIGMSYAAIASEFNETGVKTARGGNWDGSTVRNIVVRAAK